LMEMVSESWARSVGAETRQMLANAITDAKTNFFIQCSWELLKWRSIFKHSLAENTTVVFGRLSTKVTHKRYLGFQCGVGRIIESPALDDKRSSEGKMECRPQGKKKRLPVRGQNPCQTAKLPPLKRKNRFAGLPCSGVSGSIALWLEAHRRTRLRETTTVLACV
jgi:hypothetical protein